MSRWKFWAKPSPPVEEPKGLFRHEETRAAQALQSVGLGPAEQRICLAFLASRPAEEARARLHLFVQYIADAKRDH